MVNRWFTPNEQFLDGEGEPYAGGKLYFYVSETSTPLTVYSDEDLQTARANPVILDSAGRAGNVFLQQAAYKVKLTDSDDNEIWTADPVWSSDYSTVAMFKNWEGNPNGLVAGTAGTQGGRPSDVIWDNINNVLYVCTTSGTASTAVWSQNSVSSGSSFVPAPTGYLTLTSGVPIIPTDVVAATTIYYTPYKGDTVPVYNGSSFIVTQFAELSLTLSGLGNATIYDVFVFNNSGVLTLVAGPAWATSTAGAGARGTGAGTTQISRINGIWVNTVQITGTNGANSYAISANLATYLGTFIIGSSNQVSCYRTFGQGRSWQLWNAYNRAPTIIQMGDATSSWSYNSSTVRASNGQNSNTLTVLTGLAEEVLLVKFKQVLQPALNVTTTIGIGKNSTTSMTGSNLGQTGAGSSLSHTIQTQWVDSPWLGINTFTSLESSTGGSTTFQGASGNMLVTAQWNV